jgi:hypothetical protein
MSKNGLTETCKFYIEPQVACTQNVDAITLWHFISFNNNQTKLK